jgi:hypothetical protein
MWTTIIFRQDKGGAEVDDDRSRIDTVYQDMQRKYATKKSKAAPKKKKNQRTIAAHSNPVPPVRDPRLQFTTLIVVEHPTGGGIIDALLLFLCRNRNVVENFKTRGFTFWCFHAIDGTRNAIVCVRDVLKYMRVRNLDTITTGKTRMLLLVKPDRLHGVYGSHLSNAIVCTSSNDLANCMNLLRHTNSVGEVEVRRLMGYGMFDGPPNSSSSSVRVTQVGDSDRFGEDEFPYDDDDDDDQDEDGGGGVGMQDADFVRNVWANNNNPNIIATNANNVNDHGEDRDYLLAVELSMQQEQPRPPPPPPQPHPIRLTAEEILSARLRSGARIPIIPGTTASSPAAVSIGPRTVGSYAASIRRIVDNRQEQRQLSSAVTTMKTDDRVAHVMKAPAAEDRDIPAMTMLREHNTCTICTTSHITTLVLPCAHYQFCRSCIELWKQKSGTCPSCRNNIDLLVDPKNNVNLRDEHNSREKAPQKYMEGLQEELQELTMRLAEKRDPTTAEEPLVIDLTQTNSILVASEPQTKRTKVE